MVALSVRCWLMMAFLIATSLLLSSITADRLESVSLVSQVRVLKCLQSFV